jgi:hypothetical protein
MGSEVLLFAPDGDVGKSVAVVQPPPGVRYDAQTEGGITYGSPLAKTRTVITPDGNMVVEVEGNCSVKIKGNASIEVDGSCSLKANGDVTVESGGTMKFKAADLVFEAGSINFNQV